MSVLAYLLLGHGSFAAFRLLPLESLGSPFRTTCAGIMARRSQLTLGNKLQRPTETVLLPGVPM